MNHKLYKIKTKKQKYNKRFPSKMETKVSTETQRQTVTPNKDIVGEREELNNLNRGEANCHVIHSAEGWVDHVGVIITVHPHV